MELKPESLFILGGPKTASTALVGALNAHPEVFVMCEVFLNNARPSRYAAKLTKAFPEFRPFFFRSPDGDFLESYRGAHRMLLERGFGMRYFGDKFVDLDSGYSRNFQEARVIYSVRRLQEWIAKDSVQIIFPVEYDIVPFAVQYTKHLLESFRLPRVCYVRMEDFREQNEALMRGVFQFLELDFAPELRQWWLTIGNHPKSDPKSAINWWRGHASSAVAPMDSDTRFTIRPHPFWDEILPIFDRYYQAAGRDHVAADEIAADLARLQGMIGRLHCPLAAAYSHRRSATRGKQIERQRKLQRRLSRFGSLVGIRTRKRDA